MSNCQRFELPHLEFVGWHLVSAALRPILHTIVFTRSFEATEPQELYENDLGVCYGAVKDQETEQYISQKIREFIQWLQKRPSHCGSLKLAFHDKPETAGHIFAQSTGPCWEEWTISVQVTERKESVVVEEVAKKVKACMAFVIQSVGVNPSPLPSVGTMPLSESFRIVIVTENKAADMFHTVHKALQDINTTSLLR